MKPVVKVLALFVVLIPTLGYAGYKLGQLMHVIIAQVNEYGLISSQTSIYILALIFPVLPAVFVYLYITKKQKKEITENDDIYMIEPFFEGSSLDRFYVLLSIIFLGSLPILLFFHIELNLPENIHYYFTFLLVTTLGLITFLYGLLLFKNTRVFYKKNAQFLVPVLSYFMGLMPMIFLIKPVNITIPERLNLSSLLIFVYAVFALLAGIKLLLTVNRAVYDKKAKAEDELNFASEIQQQFLSDRSLETDEISAYGISKAAREVGGDFLCLHKKEKPQNIVAAVGDVSGHSFGAGLIMSMLNTMVEEHLRFNNSLNNLLSNLNTKLLSQPKRNIFATFAAIEVSNYSLKLWNAGHMPLLIFRSENNKLLKFRQPGLALGMSKLASHTPNEITLLKDDYIVLYSDGLVETRDEEGNIRDEDFFEKTAEEILTRGADCKTAAQKIIQHCLDNDQNPFPEDDATLIVLHIQ